MSDQWYGYACYNPACPSSVHGDGSGVVLDFRSSVAHDSPVLVPCPLCSQPMFFKGQWAATPRGYGSRADYERDMNEAEDKPDALRDDCMLDMLLSSEDRCPIGPQCALWDRGRCNRPANVPCFAPSPDNGGGGDVGMTDKEAAEAPAVMPRRAVVNQSGILLSGGSFGAGGYLCYSDETELTAEQAQELGAAWEASDPKRRALRWALAQGPAALSGAPQLLRGPAVVDEPRWVWCTWREDAPHPGDWPTLYSWEAAPPSWVTPEQIAGYDALVERLRAEEMSAAEV